VSKPSFLVLYFFYSLCATFLTYRRGVYKISVILRTDRPTDWWRTNDRPLFLEEPSWKNFKRPYLRNSAR